MIISIESRQQRLIKSVKNKEELSAIESKIISNVPEEEHFESVFKNEEFGNEKSFKYEL